MLGGARELGADVAGGARGLIVRAGQRKFRGRMVELRVRPRGGVVARAAAAAQLALMNVSFLVTCDALIRRLAERLASGVAAAASGARVAAGEREVGEIVIECRGAEFDDVRLAALMFRVTRTTLRALCVWHATVIAPSGARVRGDVLVTGEAQLRLTRPVAAVMTLRAILFEVGMTFDHLAWHQKLFDAGRGCAAGARQEREQSCHGDGAHAVSRRVPRSRASFLR